MERKKVTLGAIQAKKDQGEKLTMLTSYDAPTARMVDEAGIDMILVGDSVGNVVLGYKDTVPVTMDEMLHHTRAVTRAVKYAYVIGDMPFMSYQTGERDALLNAGRFLKEAGADAVKLEGGVIVAETVRSMVKFGIPVQGHIGLTPQSAQVLGGFRVQGRDAASAKRLMEDALCLEDAGVFSIVLECVPSEVMKEISARLKVPTIGIGAGKDADGQVLVFHDMVGIRSGFTPKFVKKYADLNDVVARALGLYKSEVERGEFPALEQSFFMEAAELKKFKASLKNIK